MVEENIIDEMKSYAEENNVPIMTEDGIEFLTNYCKEHKVSSVLEIGTAIGYSSICMILKGNVTKITTIERDEKRYLEAIKNVKKVNLEDKIDLIYNDALEVSILDKYDLIFIDAAKAQSIKFFEKFSKNLNDNGTIITDNMNFHGLVKIDEKEIESRNLRQLVRKIKNYKEYLKENKEYNSEFIDLGDGIAITKKN